MDEFKPQTSHPGEPHGTGLTARLNWLRAGVLGANDGVTSTAGVVVGVAGATSRPSQLLIAGTAALVAGALSMAVGEYVSVSTQRDSEQALLSLERRELVDMPVEEMEELTQIYQAKGLDRELAEQVATQLTEKDALRAHADAELGIDVEQLASPMAAAAASMFSFTLGALIPLLSILAPIGDFRIPLTFFLVLITLALTGYISARLGMARPGRAVLRNMAGGGLAMAVTFGIGHLIGGAVG